MGTSARILRIKSIDAHGALDKEVDDEHRKRIQVFHIEKLEQTKSSYRLVASRNFDESNKDEEKFASLVEYISIRLFLK